MSTQRTGTYDSDTIPARDDDRVVDDTARYATRPSFADGARIGTGENVMTVRNRVQWGPIVAGLVSAIATFLLMTVLGIAIGASVLDPADSGQEIGTWAAVWGGISAIVAFFVGGWLAARTAAVGGSFAGLVNGFLVGASGLVLILWLTGTGLGNVFGTLSANLGDILNVAQDTAQAQNVTPTEAQDQAQQAVDQVASTVNVQAEDAFDTVRDSAFGTFLGLLLPLVAAALGGWLGHNTRRELIEGTG